MRSSDHWKEDEESILSNGKVAQSLVHEVCKFSCVMTEIEKSWFSCLRKVMSWECRSIGLLLVECASNGKRDVLKEDTI